ncbi:MAG: hypothetical protein FJ280_06745, partial [Planctomycetes bacterium]|nr:hypothetical protein [Planctomycetota bacterium]
MRAPRPTQRGPQVTRGYTRDLRPPGSSLRACLRSQPSLGGIVKRSPGSQSRCIAIGNPLRSLAMADFPCAGPSPRPTGLDKAPRFKTSAPRSAGRLEFGIFFRFEFVWDLVLGIWCFRPRGGFGASAPGTGYLLLFLLVAAFLCGRAVAAQKPNIVLILADDLGWADLGCYGSDLHETPHLDRLATEGVRFTQAYAMPVCSPSRAALLTGQHAARVRITIWSEGSLKGPANRRLLQADSRHDLPHSETTLAQRLHDGGYLTALVGKWHLGDANHYPETHGFDVNIGGTHWGAPQTFWWPYRGRERFGEFRYVPHLEFGKPGEYLTDRLTDEALRVIDHAGDKP